MAKPFESLAGQLAAATGIVGEGPKSKALQEIGGAFGAGITSELKPFKDLAKKEAATGENAASPYRLDLVVKLDEIGGGDKAWTALGSKFRTLRDELLSWKPGKKVKIKGKEINETKEIKLDNVEITALPKPKPGTGEFGSEKFMYAFGDIDITRNTKGKVIWRYRKNKDDENEGWELLTGKQLAKFIGQPVIQHIGTGKFEPEKEVIEGGPERKRPEIRKEMNELRKQINRSIPSKTELEKMYHRQLLVVSKQRRGGIGDGLSKFDQKVYFKFLDQNDRLVKRLSDGDKNMIGIEGIKDFGRPGKFASTFVMDNSQGMNPQAIINGKGSALWNSTAKALNNVDAAKIRQLSGNYERSVLNDMESIQEQKTEALKLLKSYELILRVAPVSMNAEQTVANMVTGEVFTDAMGLANVTADDYKLGVYNIPRYGSDYYQMVEDVLNQRKTSGDKKYKLDYTPFTKMHDRLVDKLEDTVPLGLENVFRKNTNAEDVVGKIREQLLENNAVNIWAPSSEEELRNPTKPEMKSWIALWQAVTDTNDKTVKFREIKKHIEDVKKGRERAGKISPKGL